MLPAIVVLSIAAFCVTPKRLLLLYLQKKIRRLTPKRLRVFRGEALKADRLVIAPTEGRLAAQELICRKLPFCASSDTLPHQYKEAFCLPGHNLQPRLPLGPGSDPGRLLALV